MDAVTYLWKELGTPSVHHPKTHALLRLLRAFLETAAPWVVLLTETNVPHAENVAYFGAGDDEAQMVYNFALPPLLLHTVASGDAGPLRDWAAHLRTPSEQTWFLNFLASHDGIGVRPVEGAAAAGGDRRARRPHRTRGRPDRAQARRRRKRERLRAEREPVRRALRSGARGALDRQVDRFVAAHAVMAALPGVPALYLHSLLGSRGAPELVAASGVPRAINREKLDEATLLRELADPDGRRARIVRALRRLLRARRPAGVPSERAGDGAGPPIGVFGVRRGRRRRRHVRSGTGRAGREAHLDRPGSDVLTGDRFSAGELRLAPYEVLWIAS